MLGILMNPNNKRIYGLDVLRAFAILFVLLGHSRHLLPEKIKEKVMLFILDGVSIFFVLSGFLIGGILIKLLEEKKLDKRSLINFWVRRWFRTLPLYFLVLTFILVIKGEFLDGFTIFKFYTFSQNLFYPHPSFFSEAWSLSVEEWFYIIVPLIMFFVVRISFFSVKKTILFVILILLILFTSFRIYRFSYLDVNSIPEWNLWYRMQVFTRLDSVMYGVLGAYINFYFKEKWNRYRVQFLILGVSLSVLYRMLLYFNLQGFGFYLCVLSFLLTSFGTLFSLPFFTSLKEGSGFIYKILTSISLISYSMYLVNSQILGWLFSWNKFFNNFFGNQYLTIIFIYISFWVLTIGTSIFLYKYFEIPFMNLRDKKFFSYKNM